MPPRFNPDGRFILLLSEFEGMVYDFPITKAQINAGFTTPILVLPGEPGWFHIPFKGHLHLEGAGGYTAGGATAMVVRNTDAAGAVRLTSFDVTLITGAGPQSGVLTGPTSNGTGISGATGGTTDLGVNHVFHIATANPTGGVGDLRLTYWFHRFPNGRIVL